MTNAKKNTDEVANLTKANDPTVEVLYQKLGDSWYAFSIIDDEVFFGKVPGEGSDAIHPDHGKKVV